MLELEPKNLDARSWSRSLKFEYRLHASLERLYSVSLNRVMSLSNDHKNNIIGPSDAVDLGCLCNTNSLFEFPMVHRYVFIVV